MKAVMYLPADDQDRWTARCLEHITRRDHHLAAVVTAVPGDDRWSTVEQLLATGEADLVVVALREHLVRPAVEVAAEFWPSDGQPRGRSQARTGRVRPGERFTEPRRTRPLPR